MIKSWRSGERDEGTGIGRQTVLRLQPARIARLEHENEIEAADQAVYFDSFKNNIK